MDADAALDLAFDLALGFDSPEDAGDDSDADSVVVPRSVFVDDHLDDSDADADDAVDDVDDDFDDVVVDRFDPFEAAAETDADAEEYSVASSSFVDVLVALDVRSSSAAAYPPFGSDAPISSRSESEACRETESKKSAASVDRGFTRFGRFVASRSKRPSDASGLLT